LGRTIRCVGNSELTTRRLGRSGAAPIPPLCVPAGSVFPRRRVGAICCYDEAARSGESDTAGGRRTVLTPYPEPLRPVFFPRRGRATRKADYFEALADEVQRGGIGAWKALRDLLPRNEDTPSGSPSVSFGQLFIAAHKEINRLEQASPMATVHRDPIGPLSIPNVTSSLPAAYGPDFLDQYRARGRLRRSHPQGRETGPTRRCRTRVDATNKFRGR
jgi:hypothetical protein